MFMSVPNHVCVSLPIRPSFHWNVRIIFFWPRRFAIPSSTRHSLIFSFCTVTSLCHTASTLFVTKLLLFWRTWLKKFAHLFRITSVYFPTLLCTFLSFYTPSVFTILTPFSLSFVPGSRLSNSCLQRQRFWRVQNFQYCIAHIASYLRLPT